MAEPEIIGLVCHSHGWYSESLNQNDIGQDVAENFQAYVVEDFLVDVHEDSWSVSVDVHEKDSWNADADVDGDSGNATGDS